MEEITLDKEILEMKKYVNHFKMCEGPFPSGLIEESTPDLFIEPTKESIKKFKPTKGLTEKEIEEIFRKKKRI